MTAQGAVERPTGARFTAQHAAGLLATLSALDGRLKANDEATATIRVNAWAALLGEVDPGYAMKYAQRAYQQVRDWPLQPAEILQEWRREQAAAQQGDDRSERLEQGELGVTRPAGAMRDYLRAVFAALQAGQPFDSVPRPVGVGSFSPARDARERRCVFHRLCACDHTKCREGYLDAEHTLVIEGQSYPAVEACPFCHDALLMADEQGLAMRPTTRGGGRRR